MAALASSMGLPFSMKGPDIGMLESTGINLFQGGWSRHTVNLIRWNVSGDIPAQIFDYRYKQKFGRSNADINVSVALVNLAKPLPPFMLRPEEFSDKLAGLAGFDDINIGEHPVFSKKYFLKGGNKDDVKALFSPEIIMFFETRSDWCVESAEGFLAFWKGIGYLKSENYPVFMEEIKEIILRFRGQYI